MCPTWCVSSVVVYVNHCEFKHPMQCGMVHVPVVSNGAPDVVSNSAPMSIGIKSIGEWIYEFRQLTQFVMVCLSLHTQCSV